MLTAGIEVIAPGSAAGAFDQVTEFSAQEVLVTLCTLPPCEDAFTVYRRSFTLVTVPVPIPVTLNFIRLREAGEASTSSAVAEPRLLEG